MATTPTRSLCRNLTIAEHRHEPRLELELGPAIEGTAAGWLGILATRYLAAMLERPLRTREIELTASASRCTRACEGRGNLRRSIPRAGHAWGLAGSSGFEYR